MTENKQVLVAFSWDGKSPPLEHLSRDTTADFELLLFDYSGQAHRPDGVDRFLSARTEGKGQVLDLIAKHIGPVADTYEYIAPIDDDIAISVSSINRIIAIGRSKGLDSFAPGLGPGSFCAHSHFLHRLGSELREVPWVEIMMPFYRSWLFMDCAPYYACSISSQGLDEFVAPAMQKIRGSERTAVIDAVVAEHLRPITSHKKRFSNGLFAIEERAVVRRMVLAQIAAVRPDLVGTRWYYRTFARLDGPARFWPLRLVAPWHWLKRYAGNLLA